MSDLERTLITLGREIEFPGQPDLVAGVLARLDRPSERRRSRVRRWQLGVVLALVAALGAVLAIPDARSALLRVLQLGGSRIELVDELPDVRPEPIGFDLVLGDIVTLDEARRRATVPLRELEGEAPDRVYAGPRGTIWLLWGGPQRVKLLLAQTPRLALGDATFLKKLAGEGTSVESVSVGSAPGYFLSGAPHVVYLAEGQGEPVREIVWLARNVLLWEEHGLALRLEGDFSKEQALELAGRVRARG